VTAALPKFRQVSFSGHHEKIGQIFKTFPFVSRITMSLKQRITILVIIVL